MKIVKENALPDIENYMFEEHDQIRQAATECMCNLVTCKEVRITKQLKPHIITDNAYSQNVQQVVNKCGCIKSFTSVCFRSKIVIWQMEMIR